MGCDLAQTLLVGKVHFINGLFKRCKILQNTLVNKNVPYFYRYYQGYLRKGKDEKTFIIENYNII